MQKHVTKIRKNIPLKKWSYCSKVENIIKIKEMSPIEFKREFEKKKKRLTIGFVTFTENEFNTSRSNPGRR